MPARAVPQSMTPILANVIWPALILEGRLLSVLVIAAGLVIEFPFVLRLTDLSPKRCLVADLTMNAVSTLAGIILIPLSGLVWEVSLGAAVQAIFHLGTFNPAAWIGTGVFAALTNAGIEATVLRFVFKQRITKASFCWFWLANGLSVAPALLSLYLHPPRL